MHEGVWHISLGAVPEVVEVGIGIHGFSGNETYRLPDLWCLHLYGYSAKVRLGDNEYAIDAGSAGIIPADIRTEYIYARECAPYRHLFVHFRVTQNPKLASDTVEIPIMCDLGQDYGAVRARFQRLLGAGTSSGTAARTNAALWETLWDLADRPKSYSIDAHPEWHPAVAAAAFEIDIRMSEQLSVARLAEHADVSYGYLSRLFRDAYGVSVVGYIRSVRLRRAVHLLRNTSLPIKSIAAAVGIPDLHLFNKTVRRELGQAPRLIRSGINPAQGERPEG